jgi:two-component system response regulator AlgR
MNPLKVLIVDDEPLARARLTHMLKAAPAVVVVGEAANGLDALAAIGTQVPDVILLDIRMPGMDGLETARHLAGLTEPPAVVFTTAYGDHALAAFDASAVDYLLKPIREERLLKALAKVESRKSTVPRLPTVEDGTRTHLSAMMKGRLRLVAVADVRFLQADQKYVTVAWPDGELLVEDSLKSLEEEFGSRFLRVHRNALAARAYIRSLEKDDAGNWLMGFEGLTMRLPVSRRLVAQVRKSLSKLGINAAD